jgi:hypothetical protein
MTVLRLLSRTPRQLQQRLARNPTIRHTASRAAFASQDTHGHGGSPFAVNPLLVSGMLAAAAGITWQQKKSSDCCGIIGVVAHKDFDAR